MLKSQSVAFSLWNITLFCFFMLLKYFQINNRRMEHQSLVILLTSLQRFWTIKVNYTYHFTLNIHKQSFETQLSFPVGLYGWFYFHVFISNYFGSVNIKSTYMWNILSPQKLQYSNPFTNKMSPSSLKINNWNHSLTLSVCVAIQNVIRCI